MVVVATQNLGLVLGKNEGIPQKESPRKKPAIENVPGEVLEDVPGEVPESKGRGGIS